MRAEERHNKGAKLQRHLVYKTSKAIHDYNMIEENDRVMVCLSGGKDSYALLDILRGFNKKSREKFEIIAVHLDQNMPDFPVEKISEYMKVIKIPFHIIKQDIYSVILEKVQEGKPVCSLCSRLRRGALYNFAEKNNISKIALGHHLDDIVETLLLNMFYGGKLKAMPPKLLSDNKKNIVIRPLSYISEKNIIKFTSLKNFPVISGKFCGINENKQRKVIKSMVTTWRKEFPGRVEKIFSSLQNVETSLLADCSIYDFENLNTE